MDQEDDAVPIEPPRHQAVYGISGFNSRSGQEPSTGSQGSISCQGKSLLLDLRVQFPVRARVFYWISGFYFQVRARVFYWISGFCSWSESTGSQGSISSQDKSLLLDLRVLFSVRTRALYWISGFYSRSRQESTGSQGSISGQGKSLLLDLRVLFLVRVYWISGFYFQSGQESSTGSQGSIPCQGKSLLLDLRVLCYSSISFDTHKKPRSRV